MATKPSIPKGTRDFTPEQMARRNYIFSTIKSVFRLYGFQQIETPALENLSTLMGKYGEEGDKLLFKVLNSGDWKTSLTEEQFVELNSIQLTNKISEKGLRYDLTVPFARFVVQNRDKIQFPFKRYQIQPVWRADRPQKGRYREFYQCDVDVVGTDSLMCEVELIQIVQEVYRRLGINVCFKINNRKILAGIAEYIGAPDKMVDITVAIDKLDKIGLENVNAELLEKGLTEESISLLQPVLKLEGNTAEKLSVLTGLIGNTEVGKKGIEEVTTILTTCETLGLGSEAFEIELDLTLARGLNYYTGAIFEVKAKDVAMGSITGGGRYDNLTGIFGMPGVSGVGISFGADRIYDVLAELNLYPTEMMEQTKLLFTTFDEVSLTYAQKWARQLRMENINVEVYPEATKMKRQMGYADGKQIPYVAIVGDNEMQTNTVMLKNMLTGEQKQVTLDEIVNLLK